MSEKLYLTHLTFSDTQRKDFAKTPADDAKMEFPELMEDNECLNQSK